jgi:hypothetical protein
MKKNDGIKLLLGLTVFGVLITAIGVYTVFLEVDELSKRLSHDHLFPVSQQEFEQRLLASLIKVPSDYNDLAVLERRPSWSGEQVLYVYGYKSINSAKGFFVREGSQIVHKESISGDPNHQELRGIRWSSENEITYDYYVVDELAEIKTVRVSGQKVGN